MSGKAIIDSKKARQGLFQRESSHANGVDIMSNSTVVIKANLNVSVSASISAGDRNKVMLP